MHEDDKGCLDVSGMASPVLIKLIRRIESM